MQKPLYIQLIPLIILTSLLIKRMLGDIIFVRQKWTYTSKLQDALVTIHDCNLIHGHEILSTLLIVHGVGWIVAPAFASVIHVDGFFSQELGQILQSGWLSTSKKQLGIPISNDGIRVVLIDSFQL